MAHWWVTTPADKTGVMLYERHYSCYHYKDGRKRKQFASNGEKLVLRTAAGDAFFVWINNINKSIDPRTGQRQEGVCCSFFRNESNVKSSVLIKEADAIADFCWTGLRHYTAVNPARVRSTNPGFCFQCAGWKFAFELKRKNDEPLLYFEKTT